MGNITAPRIAIAEGVMFEGKCTMKAPGEAQPPAVEKSVVEFAKAANEKK